MSFGAMSSMAGSLPPNARYVTHRNECYDWGTLGWLLNTKQVTSCSGLAVGWILPASSHPPLGWTCARTIKDAGSNCALLHAP